MPQKIYFRNAKADLVAWRRAYVRDLPIAMVGSAETAQLNEADKTDKTKVAEIFLESLIAEKPDLLGIGGTYDETDIEGNVCAFRQVQLRALNGRTIYPDIILLWQSGDVVVVEVKLADNAELRDRRVVAQVLEYAACLAQRSEQ